MVELNEEVKKGWGVDECDRKTIFERGPLPITFIVLWTVSNSPLADASGSKVDAISKLDSQGILGSTSNELCSLYTQKQASR